MKARFIENNGTRIYLRRFNYSSAENIPECNNRTYHDAQIFLKDIEKDGINNPIFFKTKEELLINYPIDKWPIKCDYCDYVFSDNDEFQLHRKRLYNTPSRFPEAGDLYYADWYKGEPRLMGITPNGKLWNIDGMANNCTKPNDGNHKCWTRKGEPPNVDVGKQYGPTCNAGAGSIVVDGWHGFLRNGVWVEC
jgi:hypothetical protein